MKPREREHAAQMEALRGAADSVPFIGGEDMEQALVDAVTTLRNLHPESHEAMGLLAYTVGPHLDEETQLDEDAWLLAAQQLLTLALVLLTALVHDLATALATYEQGANGPDAPESKVVLH